MLVDERARPVYDGRQYQPSFLPLRQDEAFCVFALQSPSDGAAGGVHVSPKTMICLVV